MTRTIIIGLGNPILSDDSVGIKVARVLKDTLGDNDIDVKELYAGGIRLVEAMEGYERAIIVDAMVTGKAVPGSVCEVELSESGDARNITSVHDIDLPTAMKLGRSLSMDLPEEITIFGIEIRGTNIFGEELSAEVAGSVDIAVKAIEGLLCSVSGRIR